MKEHPDFFVRVQKASSITRTKRFNKECVNVFDEEILDDHKLLPTSYTM